MHATRNSVFIRFTMSALLWIIFIIALVTVLIKFSAFIKLASIIRVSFVARFADTISFVFICSIDMLTNLCYLNWESLNRNDEDIYFGKDDKKKICMEWKIAWCKNCADDYRECKDYFDGFHIEKGKCIHDPTLEFTNSKYFSKSDAFSKSNSISFSLHFSKSLDFSPSSKFSKSNGFTFSYHFISSDIFSFSSQFSSSRYFSHSSPFSFSSMFSFSSYFFPSLILTFSPII